MMLNLRQKIKEISRNFQQYGQEDVRYAVFVNVEGKVIHAAIMFNLFSGFSSNAISDETAKAVLGISIKDPSFWTTMKDMANNEKASFVTLTNFSVEVFCKVVLQALINQNPNGYYNVISALTKLTTADPQTKLRELYTLALIRNALHANGYHVTATVPPYHLQGHTFKFDKGGKIDCASWPQIVAATAAAVKIVAEIAISPKVKLITSQLPVFFTAT